ncbi:hypothetical protein [Candidatus Spongiihabitans sp.]|uniref:hypothetical protein n=1 Tax=Candidatus Spongiihabitans sp. TaxID=3101308 RepID=UPI003C6F81DA
MKNKLPKLDVVLIATIRADTLRMTLSSFTKNFLHQFDVRIIITVDPVGETEKNSQMDIVEICREYFDKVTHRTPKTASFSDAVKWAWQQVETELFFHLEDDWILKRKVSAQENIDLFQDENVVNVIFNKYPQEGNFLHVNKVEFYNKKYIYFPSISLNPSLFRTRYSKELANKLDTARDPEFQFGGDNATELYPNPKFLWRVSKTSLIIDTGNSWRRAVFIHKSAGDDITTKWISVNSRIRIRDRIRKIKRTALYCLRKWYWQVRYCRPLDPPKKRT